LGRRRAQRQSLRWRVPQAWTKLFRNRSSRKAEGCEEDCDMVKIEYCTVVDVLSVL
jgi:hypothetical protein